MIRAAIVGIGRWGRMLVNSVQDKSTAIRFTAGHTRTRSSAEAFCADNGIALQDDAILADPAIDAVVFATPHSQHAAQVERTAAAGKHVFMEKPFTLDVKSAEAALDAIARVGVVLGVAYPRRFHPAMIELKARVQDGPGNRDGHPLARRDVRRPADNLEGLALTEGDGREGQPVGAGMLLDGQQLADDDVLPVAAPALDPLDLDPEQGQPLGKLLWGQLHIDVLSQPADRDSHANCSRKRRSFSMYSRRSPTE